MARPTKLTPIVVKKLEEAFALGCTDEEACIYGGISKQTLYNYQDKNKEFLDQKELLKKRPVLEARKAVIGSFKQNPNLAFKYLEKKKRDEFGLHSEEVKDNIVVNLVRYADFSDSKDAEKSIK